MATAFQVNAFQNNAFQVTVTPTPAFTGGDGWTKEEWKHYKNIEKKRQKAEEKRNTAFKNEQELRKQTIRDLVDPESKARRLSKNKVKKYHIFCSRPRRKKGKFKKFTSKEQNYILSPHYLFIVICMCRTMNIIFDRERKEIQEKTYKKN